MCLNCATGVSLCTQCNNFYYVSSNSTCVECPNTPQCLICNPSNPQQCQTCNTGFFLNNNICTACPSYCASCSSATLCLTLVNPVGFVLMTVNGASVLANCDPGCNQCTSNDPSFCTNCAQGFYLNSGICLPCTITSKCQACSQANSTVCTSCFPGAFLSNSVCVSCQSPCVTCTSATQLSSCTSCPSGYILSNATCTPPPANGSNSCGVGCANCMMVGNTSTCTLCNSGYVLNSGVCTPCLSGCSVCSNTNFAICLTCAQGNYLNTAAGNICTPCASGCYFCNEVGCTNCMPGYYMTSTFTCSQLCLHPCATCSTSNPSICLTCVAGYIIDSAAIQNCAPTTSCMNSKNCNVCPFGFKLLYSNTAQAKNQTCVTCAQSSNCARCLTSSPSVCTSCTIGNYLNPSNICVACNAGCANCLSKTSCLTCSVGYVAQLPGAVVTPQSALISSQSATINAQLVNCIICSLPCATCTNSPSTCLTCIAGFNYEGNQCVSAFNFGVSVTLSVTPQVFNQNYLQFLQALANSISTSISSITVLSISLGSTIVNTQVSTTAAPGSA